MTSAMAGAVAAVGANQRQHAAVLHKPRGVPAGTHSMGSAGAMAPVESDVGPIGDNGVKSPTAVIDQYLYKIAANQECLNTDGSRPLDPQAIVPIGPRGRQQVNGYRDPPVSESDRRLRESVSEVVAHEHERSEQNGGTNSVASAVATAPGPAATAPPPGTVPDERPLWRAPSPSASLAPAALPAGPAQQRNAPADVVCRTPTIAGAWEAAGIGRTVGTPVARGEDGPEGWGFDGELDRYIDEEMGRDAVRRAVSAEPLAVASPAASDHAAPWGQRSRPGPSGHVPNVPPEVGNAWRGDERLHRHMEQLLATEAMATGNAARHRSATASAPWGMPRSAQVPAAHHAATSTTTSTTTQSFPQVAHGHGAPRGWPVPDPAPARPGAEPRAVQATHVPLRSGFATQGQHVAWPQRPQATWSRTAAPPMMPAPSAAMARVAPTAHPSHPAVVRVARDPYAVDRRHEDIVRREELDRQRAALPGAGDRRLVVGAHGVVDPRWRAAVHGPDDGSRHGPVRFASNLSRRRHYGDRGALPDRGYDEDDDDDDDRERRHRHDQSHDGHDCEHEYDHGGGGDDYEDDDPDGHDRHRAYDRYGERGSQDRRFHRRHPGDGRWQGRDPGGRAEEWDETLEERRRRREREREEVREKEQLLSKLYLRAKLGTWPEVRNFSLADSVDDMYFALSNQDDMKDRIIAVRNLRQQIDAGVAMLAMFLRIVVPSFPVEVALNLWREKLSENAWAIEKLAMKAAGPRGASNPLKALGTGAVTSVLLAVVASKFGDKLSGLWETFAGFLPESLSQPLAKAMATMRMGRERTAHAHTQQPHAQQQPQQPQPQQQQQYQPTQQYGSVFGAPPQPSPQQGAFAHPPAFAPAGVAAPGGNVWVGAQAAAAVPLQPQVTTAAPAAPTGTSHNDDRNVTLDPLGAAVPLVLETTAGVAAPASSFSRLGPAPSLAPQQQQQEPSPPTLPGGGDRTGTVQLGSTGFGGGNPPEPPNVIGRQADSSIRPQVSPVANGALPNGRRRRAVPPMLGP